MSNNSVYSKMSDIADLLHTEIILSYKKSFPKLYKKSKGQVVNINVLWNTVRFFPCQLHFDCLSQSMISQSINGLCQARYGHNEFENILKYHYYL